MAMPLQSRITAAMIKKFHGSVYKITHKSIRPTGLVNVGIVIDIHREKNVKDLVITPAQFAAMDARVGQELRIFAQRLVREAKFLCPRPATVPRVTVPSLAGPDRAGGQSTPGAALLARLGNSRMELLSKHKFIDTPAFSKKKILAGGGLAAIRRSGRGTVRDIISMHEHGTSTESRHKAYIGKLYVGAGNGSNSYRATGNLKKSIFCKVEGFTVRLYATAKYARDMEFGRGRRGKKFAHPPIDAVMKNIIKYNTQEPGMRAQPFLYPATLREVAKLEKNIIKIVDSVLK
jgi:hypothetical protein